MKALHSADIHGLSHDGRGIATINGKTTFIRGALPGESVLFTYHRRHGRFDEGEAQQIITPAPQRVTPHCPHFGVCGGCSLQHMSSEQQITFKQQALLEQLKHFGHVIPQSVLPPLLSAPWHYRRRARLGVKQLNKKGKVLVGFHEVNHRYTADLICCPVLHTRVSTLLPALSQLISQLAAIQSISHIEVVIGDDAVALVFRHLIPLIASDRQHFIAFAKQHDLQIYLQPNSPLPLEKLWPADECHELNYRLPEYQLELLFQPGDFTQVNAELNQRMVAQALALLDPQPHENILDLFCGIGNFTLPIARNCRNVVGIEGSEAMVLRAQRNATHNRIDNVQFCSHNLEKALLDLNSQCGPFDKIVLDPPRTGALTVVKHIAQFAAKRIVYISCNPATLARDAGELVQQGYRLTTVGVMDMFPHTQHIECMAQFIYGKN